MLAASMLARAPDVAPFQEVEPALLSVALAVPSAGHHTPLWPGSREQSRWRDPSETLFQPKKTPLPLDTAAADDVSLLGAWSRLVSFIVAALILVVSVCWALCLL
jgi:hypothetical protein